MMPTIPERSDNLESPTTLTEQEYDELVSSMRQSDGCENEAWLNRQAELVTEAKAETKTTLYKFASDLKTATIDEETYTADRLKEIVEETKKGYEVFRNDVRPFYDYEVTFDSIKEGRAQWKTHFMSSYRAVRDRFQDSLYFNCMTIYAFDASGKVKKDDTTAYKVSFHYIVGNIGFYAYGKLIPRINATGFDQSVYNNQDSRQLFRLPYASKDGKTRLLKRIVLENDEPMIYDDMDEAMSELNETYADWLVSNITGELEIVDVDTLISFEESKYMDNTEQIQSSSTMSYEALNELVNLIAPNGQQELSWDEWIKVVWATMYVARRFSIHQACVIVHEFSKKSSKYCAREVNKAINSLRDQNSAQKRVGIKTLLTMAQQYNPAGLKLWRNKYSLMKGIDRKDDYLWYDFVKDCKNQIFDHSEAMYVFLRKQTNRVLVKILEGTGCYLKKDDTSSKAFNMISGIAKTIDFPLKYKVPIEKKSKNGETSIEQMIKTVKFSSVVSDIVPEYSAVVWAPSGTNNDHQFNIWAGMEANLVEEVDETKIQPLLDLMKNAICAGDDDKYDFLIKLLASTVQKLDTPPGVALMLASGQGYGKNSFVDFLRKYVFGDINSTVSAGIGPVVNHFNADIQGKKLGIINELCSSRDEFTTNFDTFKTLITEDRIKITKKGIDSFDISSAMLWILNTNHMDSVRIEADDRRFACYEVSDYYKNNSAFWANFRSTCLNQTAGDHFYTFLMQQELDNKPLHLSIPMTDMKRDIIQISRPNWQRFLIEKRDEYIEQKAQLAELQNKDSVTLDTEAVTDLPNPVQYISGRELYQSYCLWCQENGESNKITMTKLGVNCSNVMTKCRKSGGVVYDIETLKL